MAFETSVPSSGFFSKIFQNFLPLSIKYKAQQRFPEKVSLILSVIDLTAISLTSLHCTPAAFMPKIALVFIVAVSGRKT